MFIRLIVNPLLIVQAGSGKVTERSLRALGLFERIDKEEGAVV